MSSQLQALPDFRPTSPLPHELTRSQISTAISNSSRTILNRLRSIHNDSRFALAVHEAFHGRLPLVVNKRAGEWYVPPLQRTGSVYFKSTDGHTGNWGFSLRRLNLNLLEIIEKGGGKGAIIVDSTRRGKRYPDSLSKTIPIWCSVLNSILFPSTQPPTLFTPPQAISPQENHYMNTLLPAFVSSFLSLSINLPSLMMLKKPLRPFFITPDDYFLPDIDPGDESTSLIFEDYTPLVLISVSRVVKNDGLEGEYIQGAGDDSENWLKSVDLDPTFFWNHHERILACHSDDEVVVLIKSLRELVNIPISPTGGVGMPMKTYPVSLDKSLFILSSPLPMGPNARLEGRATRLGPNPSKGVGGGPNSSIKASDESYSIIIDVSSSVNAPASPSVSPKPAGDEPEPFIFKVPMPKGKPAKTLRDNILPKLLEFLTQAVTHSPATILVVSDTPGDVSVAIALFVLCLWYPGTGTAQVQREALASIDKGYIRQRLAWISSVMGEHASPSRANLNSVNAVLMQRTN